VSRGLREREWELGEDWSPNPAGIYVPTTLPNRRDRPVGVDLFCGAGGFSLGMIQGGFDVLLGLDNDPLCAFTYTYNLGRYPCQFHFVTEQDREAMERVCDRALRGAEAEAEREGKPIVPPVVGGTGIQGTVEHFILGDVRQVSGSRILEILGMERGEVGCVFGSPPCQGFSRQGRRQVMDPRNSLLFEFARLVCEIQPKTVVMENVPDVVTMVSPEGLSMLDSFCMILEEGGMGTFEALKRSLLASSGAGALVKGKPPAVKPRRRGKVGRRSGTEPGHKRRALALVGEKP